MGGYYLDKVNRMCELFLEHSLKVLGFESQTPECEALDEFLVRVPAEGLGAT